MTLFFLFAFLLVLRWRIGILRAEADRAESDAAHPA